MPATNDTPVAPARKPPAHAILVGQGPVVCGTDFTPNAASACTVAALLAVRAGAPLTLVHALPEPVAGDPIPAEALIEAASQALHEEAMRVQAETGVAVREALCRGAADEALIDTAGDQGARLIVVSSLGGKPAERWQLGSVTEATAQHSGVPTLVVRKPEGLLAWASQGHALRVTVAMDLTDSSRVALQWLADQRQLGAVDVEIAHVSWTPDERWLLAGEKLQPEAERAEVERMIRQDLRAIATDVLGARQETHVHVEVGPGWTPERLARMADDEHADLVVVGRHVGGRGRVAWHRSISRGVLYHSGRSVVCVPSTYPMQTRRPRRAARAGAHRAVIATG
ncbi:MAG TPA: universal stress protein [Candidatus Eisenbacteria bacterium]|nr:universal stress protein [Candidatus Eisenbacteria bacterium]